MRLIIALAGLALLWVTAASILRTLVVPRGLYSILVNRLWAVLRRLLLLLSAPFGSYRTIDRVQTWLAPLIVVCTLATWLLGTLAAYTLMLFGTSGLDWAVCFREAGSSLFTLGFASGDRLRLSALDFIAAATGPLIIALLIGYLPTLYGAYNRREVEVTLLQSRAGEPAWGPELLARQALVGTETALPDLYRAWERLAADIGEGHSNYPVLLSFRSPQPYRNWVVGLMAVLDAAAMQLALCPRGAPPEARLVLRAGFSAMRDIAEALRIRYDPDPEPDSPIRLSYAEFDAAVAMVTATGFPAERDVAEAWPQFRGWRVNYESIGYELARRSDAVPSLWTGPRDFPSVPIPPRRPVDRRPTAG
ncbi:hypothetical protein AB0K43_07880 [Kitasatospora sp. NPDC049258]|uniref:hypothetical protein n=1 Tax=Kitasatospora sp. NPDC049258 TaxID=3155394 RepID=UPI003431FA32